MAVVVFTGAHLPTGEHDPKQAQEWIRQDLALFRRICESHDGQVVKDRGTGLLLAFSSSVNAMKACITMQEQCRSAKAKEPREQCVFHSIGVNIGDVVVEADDLVGSSVNLAARLQDLATPGRICFTELVRTTSQPTLKYRTPNSSFVTPKGFKEPIKVWSLLANPRAEKSVEERWDDTSPAPTILSTNEEKSTGSSAWLWGAVAVACLTTTVAVLAPWNRPADISGKKSEFTSEGGGAADKSARTDETATQKVDREKTELPKKDRVQARGKGADSTTTNEERKEPPPSPPPPEPRIDYGRELETAITSYGLTEFVSLHKDESGAEQYVKHAEVLLDLIPKIREFVAGHSREAPLVIGDKVLWGEAGELFFTAKGSEGRLEWTSLSRETIVQIYRMMEPDASTNKIKILEMYLPKALHIGAEDETR